MKQKIIVKNWPTAFCLYFINKKNIFFKAQIEIHVTNQLFNTITWRLTKITKIFLVLIYINIISVFNLISVYNTK